MTWLSNWWLINFLSVDLLITVLVTLRVSCRGLMALTDMKSRQKSRYVGFCQITNIQAISRPDNMIWAGLCLQQPFNCQCNIITARLKEEGILSYSVMAEEGPPSLSKQDAGHTISQQWINQNHTPSPSFSLSDKQTTQLLRNLLGSVEISIWEQAGGWIPIQSSWTLIQPSLLISLRHLVIIISYAHSLLISYNLTRHFAVCVRPLYSWDLPRNAAQSSWYSSSSAINLVLNHNDIRQRREEEV